MPHIPVPALDTLKELVKLIVVNNAELKQEITEFVDELCVELIGVGYESSDATEQRTIDLRNSLKEYFAENPDEDVTTIIKKDEDESPETPSDDDIEEGYASAPKSSQTDEDDDELEDYIKNG